MKKQREEEQAEKEREKGEEEKKKIKEEEKEDKKAEEERREKRLEEERKDWRDAKERERNDSREAEEKSKTFKTIPWPRPNSSHEDTINRIPTPGPILSSPISVLKPTSSQIYRNCLVFA